MKQPIIKVTPVILLILISLALSACPIVRGTGDAVKSVGEGVGDAVTGTGNAIGRTGRELTNDPLH